MGFFWYECKKFTFQSSVFFSYKKNLRGCFLKTNLRVSRRLQRSDSTFQRYREFEIFHLIFSLLEIRENKNYTIFYIYFFYKKDYHSDCFILLLGFVKLKFRLVWNQDNHNYSSMMFTTFSIIIDFILTLSIPPRYFQNIFGSFFQILNSLFPNLYNRSS